MEQEQNKKKVLEERKKKNDQDNNTNKKVDSDEEPSPKAPQRVEKSVKIAIGQNTDMTVEQSLAESDEKYNPYMYDTRGPKKTIDYSKPEANQDDDNDLYSFDLDATMKSAFGEYSVQHTNEKFSLANNPKTQEEKELASALEQIRNMEDQEKMKDGSILEYLKSGDYVYNLYSILIHSGSAMGGHYYAYIKSFEDGKWYNFNDGNVNVIPENKLNEELTQMYGGNASAYMLQYTQHDP